MTQHVCEFCCEEFNGNSQNANRFCCRAHYLAARKARNTLMVEMASALWALGANKTHIALAIGGTRNTLAGIIDRNRDRFPPRETRGQSRGSSGRYESHATQATVLAP